MRNKYPKKIGIRRSAQVLIVEDNEAFGRLMAKMVRRIGFSPVLAANIPEARRILAREEVRLILLDRWLDGGGDGIALCLELKKDPRTRFIPIIVLTGMRSLSEEIKGVRYGADLYLHKPIDLFRLEGYAKALLGRLPYKREVGGVTRYGNIVVRKADRLLRVGRRIYRNLPAKQFDFLALLVSRQGAPLERRFLVQELWHNQVRDKQVDVLVSRLKKRLGKAAACLICPVRSCGYRLALPSVRERAGN